MVAGKTLYANAGEKAGGRDIKPLVEAQLH